MQQAQGATMRKGEFAALRKVTPARVSQWIADGKLHGGALVGEGRDQRIVVDVAQKQLGAALDVIQVTAQSKPGGDDAQLPMSDAQRRVVEAKAEQAEIDLRRARRRELEETGVYINAAEARAVFAKQLAEVMAGLEDLMATMGDVVAAELHVDPKATTVALRREFRAWRERWSRAAADDAGREDEVVSEDG